MSDFGTTQNRQPSISERFISISLFDPYLFFYSCILWTHRCANRTLFSIYIFARNWRVCRHYAIKNSHWLISLNGSPPTAVVFFFLPTSFANICRIFLRIIATVFHRSRSLFKVDRPRVILSVLHIFWKFNFTCGLLVPLVLENFLSSQLLFFSVSHCGLMC